MIAGRRALFPVSVLVLFILLSVPIDINRMTKAHNIKQCRSKIYCNGDLLQTVQRSGLFPDSKTFVDMPSRHTEARVLAAFKKLGKNPRLNAVRAFVTEHFDAAGSDVHQVTIDDFNETPAFLKNIKSDSLRHFGQLVHGKWRNLKRRAGTRNHSAVSSSVPLKHAFMVPGGRFREFYYWDTLWIIEGLLVSNLCKEAEETIACLMEMVREYGFVPNGSRIYYLSRSQPPMLTEMVHRYTEVCLASTEAITVYLRDHIKLLDSEYQFWMEHRVAPGLKLNIYKANQDYPRPEAFREDTMIASMFDGDIKDKKLFYRDVASAAESGWDFSGRWFGDWQSISTVKTSRIIPVDLNSMLYANELQLAKWHGSLGDPGKSQFYVKNAQQRKQLMWRLLRDDQGWFDYDLDTKQLRKEHLYISSMWPMIVGLEDHDGSSTANTSTKFQQLHYPGGVVISQLNSGQQWDFPNVWAPIQHKVIEYYLNIGDRKTAVDLAQRFITSTYCGYEKYGYIFEKYHGERVGEPGGGGEYVVQDGFGWTNGVILYLLNTFPDELTAPITCTRYESMNVTMMWHVQADYVLISCVLVGLLLVGLFMLAKHFIG